jgi:hypothetical protein
MMAALLLAHFAGAQIISYTGGTCAETFDSMGPTGTNTPVGWYVGWAVPITNTIVVVGDGTAGPSGAAGWNYGLAGNTNRTLGTAAASSGGAPQADRNIVLKIANDTGADIYSFELNYDGIEWRSPNTSGFHEVLTNYVSFDQGATWILMPTNFFFTGPVPGPAQALNGYLNRVDNIGGTYTPANPVAPGGQVWIRWFNVNDSGTDGDLAIDNFSFRAVPPQPIVISTEPPEAIQVMELGSTNWTVVVQGTAPHFQWYHETTPIPWGTNATLSITNAQLTNAGAYYCAITNAVSSTNSSTVMLTVQWRPLRITSEPPVAVQVAAGGATNWTVGVSGTAPQYQWYHDGVLLPWATTAKLTITNAQASDRGSYSCTVTNAVSATNSSFVTLNVAAAPGQPGTVYLVVGSDTAIWNYPVGSPTTVDAYTRHPHYKQDSFTDPSQPSFKVMDPALRAKFTDSYGQPLKFTWWMMGGNLYRDADNLNIPLANTMTLYLMKKYHGEAIRQFGDELSLHYHTFLWSDYNGDGKYYWNQSQTFNECRADFDVTLAQYLLEEGVYPVSFRSGWHYMDNGWQQYLDQLLPYCLHDDYGVIKAWYTDPEPIGGVENWSRAPSVFVPFHPATNDYQIPGNGQGWNVRSVKMQNLSLATVNSVFTQASNGLDQVMCIWNHLPESFLIYLTNTMNLIQTAASNHPTVPYRFCTAVEGMQRWRGVTNLTPPQLEVAEEIRGQIVTLTIRCDQPIFQSQPVVGMRDAFAQYSLLSCSNTGSNTWTVTLPTARNCLAKVGIAVTDAAGNLATRILRYLPDDLYIDNLDPPYAEVLGNWSSTATAAWGTNARIARLGTGDVAQVQWALPISRSGLYSLSVQIPAITNAASNILFEVHAGGSTVQSVFFPTALPTNQWVSLGTALLDQTLSNSLEMTVTGTSQTNTFAVADVVRIVPLPDTNAPTITCSPDVVVACAGPNGAAVTFEATAVDAGDPHPVIICQPGSGTQFPLGTNTVLCTATDASGNTSSCSFTITVQAQEPPTVALLVTNVLLSAQTNCQALMPDLTGTNYLLATDNCGSVTVTQSVGTNTWLGLGSHEVVLAAVDGAGNAVYATNTVVVLDTTPPAITSPPDLTLRTDAGQNYASGVELGTPGTSDNCGVAGVVNDAPERFLVGATVVTWTVTDTSGNTNRSTQTVTVLDAEPPAVVLLVTNVLLSAQTNCQALMPDLTGTNYLLATDNCGLVTVTQSVGTNTWLGLGSHEVVLGALDGAGNAAYVTNTVVVLDAAPPVISEQPLSQTNQLGADAIFRVAAVSCGPIAYQWVLGTNALTDETNAALIVTNVGLLSAGDYSVVLVNSAGSVTSAVAVLTVNRSPVAFDRGGATTKNQPLTITVADLLGNDFDPDDDPLTLTVDSSSSQGGQVSLTSSNLIYLPPTNFVGLDSFGYGISDGRGGTASAQVHLLVAACCLPSRNQMMIEPTVSGFLIRFAAAPGQRCLVQRSTDLVNWTLLETVEVPVYGILEYEDQAPPPESAFYRIVLP